MEPKIHMASGSFLINNQPTHHSLPPIPYPFAQPPPLPQIVPHDFIMDLNEESEQPQFAPYVLLPKKDERGDIMARGFWAGRKDIIVDARITELDALSYRNQENEMVLKDHEEQTKKYPKACTDQNRCFTEFICSVDGCWDMRKMPF